MTTYISNSFKGPNGTFTGVYCRRNGEWFGGVWDRQTGVLRYGIAVYGSRAAAEGAMSRAEKAAGPGAKLLLNESALMTPARFTEIYRDRLKWSRSKFAAELGIGRNTAARYEAGEQPIPLTVRLAIAALLARIEPAE